LEKEWEEARMAKSLKQIAVPGGWDDAFVRTAIAAVAAFVALVLKEWLDTREWDVPGCAIDAAWVSGGVFALNAILKRQTGS
jgi:hypothetical protein